MCNATNKYVRSGLPPLTPQSEKLCVSLSVCVWRTERKVSALVSAFAAGGVGAYGRNVRVSAYTTPNLTHFAGACAQPKQIHVYARMLN